MEDPKKILDADKMANRTQKLLHMSEISLILDTYDDIFSDFDPRDFSERALSVDFLEEAERASKDKGSETIQLNFLIPKDKHDLVKNETIKRRLKEHFEKHCKNTDQDRRRITRKGGFFILGGVLFMLLATIVSFYQHSSPTTTFLIILFEPAGWFLFWEGLNQVIFESKKLKPALEFDEKMQRCNINFFTY